MRESKIEAHLIKRVKEIGGETRKVQWIGRDGAPDRLVMLPRRYHDLTTCSPELRRRVEAGFTLASIPPQSVFVELKAEGLAATFPNDAHERAQHREHERMRGFGLRVEVIDSIEGVEALLA